MKLSEDVQKTDFRKATAALGECLKPAGRKALASAQLLSRKQKTGERVDTFVQVFEHLQNIWSTIKTWSPGQNRISFIQMVPP